MRAVPGKLRSMIHSRQEVNTGQWSFSAVSSSFCSASPLSRPPPAPEGPVTTPKVARVEALLSRSSRSCGYGAGSSAAPGDPNASRLAGVSGTRVSDPSIEHASRSPTVTARSHGSRCSPSIAGQHPVPQPLQRRRADRLAPGGDRRRARHPVGPLPGHQGQVPEQGCLSPRRSPASGISVISSVNRIASAGVIARRAVALHPAVQRDRPGDLIDHPGSPGQLIQPLLRHAQPGVISRVPGRLHPPVAAHHRGRHRHRLQPDHQIPGGDPACPAAIRAVRPSRPSPCRAGEARSAT